MRNKSDRKLENTSIALDAKLTQPAKGGASFSLRNRLYRAVWIICWKLLASWTPPPMHGWRRILLRLFGARVSRSAHIYGSARIWFPKNLIVGRFVGVGPEATLYSMAPIILEDYATISQGAHLCAGSHDISDPDFQLWAKQIHIGSRAWIAAEAFVGPGVTVHEGAVLGARGCAMRDLDAWTVYSGNPAQPIKNRPRFARRTT